MRAWAERQRQKHPELVRVGYFGSLTDGVRYGFGSDADVVAVVAHSERQPWWQRPLDFDPPREVPVDVDLFVYTPVAWVLVLYLWLYRSDIGRIAHPHREKNSLRD